MKSKRSGRCDFCPADRDITKCVVMFPAEESGKYYQLCVICATKLLRAIFDEITPEEAERWLYKSGLLKK